MNGKMLTPLKTRVSRTEATTRQPGPQAFAWLMVFVFALQTATSLAQEQDEAGTEEADIETAELPEVDISKWRCRFCEFEEGWYSEIELGIGYVSDDSYKFGEYNGLHEKGAYAIVSGSARYRSDDASYLDLEVWDLGLDTRSLLLEGGRQGSYDIYLSYDEIPHYVSDTASTPYLGAGTDNQTLPAGWVRAGGTSGMTELDASLRDVTIETKRKRLGTGIEITTESPWSYNFDVRRDDKQGGKHGGGAFYFRAAQLVEPVDYTTDEVDASVVYSWNKWHASLGYYASTFSNNDESLIWENAFNPIVAGADEGQLALPPDNEFQQITLSAAYAFSERNHLSGEFAAGRMKQDEKLLQATINPLLSVPPLPAESADAEIETTNARLRFISLPSDKLRLSASYLYDERDNKTPQLLYDWVTTDAFLNAQRTNLPYSYTRSSLAVKADYDYARGTRLGVGVERDKRERTFQEVDETDENTLWGTVSVRNIDNLFVEMKLAFSEREASPYEAVPEISPPQNALMRKYNMADRDRQSLKFYANYTPDPYYSLGIGFETAHNDYDNSKLGLTESGDSSIDLDFTSILSEKTTASVFLGHQKIDSSQSGSQSFADPDWFASTDDSFNFFGFGIQHVLVENSMSIGFEYSNAHSRGEIELNSGEPFPDLRTQMEAIKVKLNYRLDENLSLQASYWYETYDSDDWALDGVEPDTVNALLAFGEDSPSYDVHVIALSMSYRF